jgi:hypothetical protein
MARRSSLTAAAAVAAAMTVGGCRAGDGGGNPADPTPNPNPGQPTITLTASGASPRELAINQGQRVLFVNRDSRAHEMNSDPHPDHLDCPEINLIGLLNPGQTKETGNFVAARTCGFHDHNLPDVTSLQGRIIVR